MPLDQQTTLRNNSYQPGESISHKRHYDHHAALGVLSTSNLIVGKTIGTGIFSVPSFVFASCGSIGTSLSLWCLGAIVTICGTQLYADLGALLPYSGGERVYLDYLFPWPQKLATHMFASFAVLLGSSALPCVAFGQYLVYALGIDSSPWMARAAGVCAISMICLLQAKGAYATKTIINLLGTTKLLITAFIILSGAGHLLLFGPAKMQEVNWWAGPPAGVHELSTAFLQVMFCYRGYNSINQVLQDAKSPEDVLTKGLPLAMLLTTASYLAVNLSFLLVLDTDTIQSSGTLIAALFFRKIYGKAIGQTLMASAIAVCALGSISTTAYTQARVNQELGIDGILPMKNLWPTKQHDPAATSGLLLHWLVTVSIITLPPTDQLYRFLISLSSYPTSLLCAVLSFGFIYSRLKTDGPWPSPLPASRTAVLVFGIVNIALLVLPWTGPAKQAAKSTRYPYFTYPLGGLVVVATGALYFMARKRWPTPAPSKRNSRL